MDQPSIFSSTLGLSSFWKITRIEVAAGHRRLDIYLSCNQSGSIQCQACNRKVPVCGSTKQTWYHNDFFSKEAYLHAVVPVTRCDLPCGCNELTVPWSHAGSKFVLINNELSPACAACTYVGSSRLKLQQDQTPAHYKLFQSI
ncbi:hypothetical protein OR1_02358 [Geobacter sp. OR-1]|nr:hypothetical protein OR1_02358 [Geobacter sp. OR-1]